MPWGPDDFHVYVVHQTTSIRRDAALMSAIGFLAQQAQLDFNGRLPRSTITFRDSTLSLRLSIFVSAMKPEQRVLRCHIFWGLARILNQMIHADAFTASVWRLNLGGEEVGTIFFISGNPNQLEADSNITAFAVSSALTIGPNGNPITISGVEILFGFQFTEEAMDMDHVFMGAIAALINLAQKPGDSTFKIFVEIYPGYRSYHYWFSTPPGPSLMSKEVLILSVRTTVRYALEQNNWHALRAHLKSSPGGLHIGWGGYSASKPGGNSALSILPSIHAGPLGTHPKPHYTSGYPIPSYAPPQPWNDELCQSALYPDVQLTLSFGDRLSEGRIHSVIANAKAGTKALIDGGWGNHPILAGRHDYLVGWDEERWVVIYANPYRQAPLFRNVFTFAQAAAAVGLLERCGVARGRNEEMWAYVIVRGKKVGYVWMEDVEKKRGWGSPRG
ncbi:MAG: hypothetical protein Q9221_005786, partial [Calogaya cf. arnoldii]